MIDLKQAGCQQNTMKDGTITDWSVTVDGEEVFTLPSYVTTQDTFKLRRIVEDMMAYAYSEGMKDMANTKDGEIEQLLKVGNAQLDALIEQNSELSLALERHIISNQEDY